MRPAISALPGSKIREVANAGLDRSDVLAVWFGESDEVTPEAVREAAAASLARGETIYAHNLGLAELRRAIAEYTSGLHRAVSADRIAVTSSGVNALMLAMQMLAGAGDEVAVVVPLVERLRQCRDRLLAGLSTLPGIRVATPRGGMYAFFQAEGQADSLAFAKHLVSQHGLGLAPCAAFGAKAEGWLRWCFASKDPGRLDQGQARLAWALDV